MSFDAKETDVFHHLGKRKTASLLALALAGVAALSAYAFTASNTISAHSAGAGNAQVSGYTVSNIDYTFDHTGTTMTSVEFSLDHAAVEVKAALSAADPVQADWSAPCTDNNSGTDTDWTCTFPSAVAVANGDELSVAAVDTGHVNIAP